MPHDLARELGEANIQASSPEVIKFSWPFCRRFALWLSHDVDQVYDREIYRCLANANHLVALCSGKASGKLSLCLQRIGRSIFRPKPVLRDFTVIRAIEKEFEWPSTFFFLDGNRWARYGSRYQVSDPEVRRLGSFLLDEECEIGVHGGYYDFNSAPGYARTAEVITRWFGVKPVGIRNHFLQWSYPDTWRAQAEAGFLYDATFGHNERPGYREGRSLPFFPDDVERGTVLPILELPLLLMDVTLFEHLRLDKCAALKLAKEVINDALEAGGLVSLLWHNNYFCEPEFAVREEVYRELLQWLAGQDPWCATGATIQEWWRARELATAEVASSGVGDWLIRVHAPKRLEGLCLRIRGKEIGNVISQGGASCRVRERQSDLHLEFPCLLAGQQSWLRVANRNQSRPNG